MEKQNSVRLDELEGIQGVILEKDDSPRGKPRIKYFVIDNRVFGNEFVRPLTEVGEVWMNMAYKKSGENMELLRSVNYLDGRVRR
jgi:hypothetical protein